MLGPYKDKFIAGMEHELSQLWKKNTWIEVKRSELPPDANIIKSTWAFKIARMPDGSVKKFRSRFCVRGDTQVDVFVTHAPVVQWSTIRMCLVLANQLDLRTRAIDISNAFIQADLPTGPDLKERIIMKITGVLVDILVDVAPNIYAGYVVYEKKKRSFTYKY